MLGEIVRFTRARSQFAITSHARPDGDAIGSELGLALALQSLGKSAQVVNSDPHPQVYDFLPGADQIHLSDRIENHYDGVFVLECNDLERPALKNLQQSYIINIDHHPNTKPFGSLNWLDSGASAVGEMIYHLTKALDIPLTRDISTNLYVAILTDTGSFQFSGTGPQTFAIASNLVASGADPSAIAEAVYMNQPYSKIQLLRRVLDTLQIHRSKKIAWIDLTSAMLEETGASSRETEGIVNYPLSIKGVMMVALFRQETEKTCGVSLRSKKNYDVGSLAERLGGGGHKNAAGVSLSGDFEEVRQTIISEMERLLDSARE